ncbi:MAG: DUF3617 family protein [Pseudomonadota bacterium]
MKPRIAVLALAIALPACSGGGVTTEQADTNGDGVVSSDEAVAASAGLDYVDREPGLYRGTVVDTSVDQGPDESQEDCVTQEQIDEPVDWSLPDICVYEKFDLTADTVSIVVRCEDSVGFVTRNFIDSVITPTQRTTIASYESGTRIGDFSLDAKFERVGECPVPEATE